MCVSGERAVPAVGVAVPGSRPYLLVLGVVRGKDLRRSLLSQLSVWESVGKEGTRWFFFFFSASDAPFLAAVVLGIFILCFS